MIDFLQFVILVVVVAVADVERSPTKSPHCFISVYYAIVGTLMLLLHWSVGVVASTREYEYSRKSNTRTHTQQRPGYLIHHHHHQQHTDGLTQQQHTVSSGGNDGDAVRSNTGSSATASERERPAATEAVAAAVAAAAIRTNRNVCTVAFTNLCMCEPASQSVSQPA